jgi:hypothetical protein
MTDPPVDVPEQIPAAPDATAAIEQPKPGTPAAGTKRIGLDQKTYDTTAIEHWARKTALAVQFIAWILGFAAAAAVILGIIAAVQLAHLNSYLSGGGSVIPGSNCLSQGGTDPSC